MNPLASITSVGNQPEVLGSAGLAALKQSLAPQTKQSASTAKIHKAAQQFEALLLSSWMQDLQETFAASGGNESDPASSSVQGLGISAIASAMANAGGMGIGKMIENYLESQPQASTPPTGGKA